MQELKIAVTRELLNLIAEIDEFKGKWEALKNMSPERLRQLRKMATIESIGSSTGSRVRRPATIHSLACAVRSGFGAAQKA